MSWSSIIKIDRAYAFPRFSKGAVDKAGQNISRNSERDEDFDILENWRASHANILNTFKTLLYNRAKGMNVQIAQRLKRRPTIIDKLDREPDMRLSRMHDIAGCRVIFENEEDLIKFRASLHQARFEHKRRGADDDRWNYIKRPKSSGYRGIHDVYTYHVEPKKGRAGEDQPWNGMLVEIQYRTAVQHAWATAVELAGLVTENNPKFDRGSEDFIEYFRVCSELLSRIYENNTSCFPLESDASILIRYIELEDRTHILRIFSELRRSESQIDLSKSSILIFRYDFDLFHKDQLEIRQFDSVNLAIQEYNKLEVELDSKADVVLVGSRSAESIKSAYRNYFSDAQEFVKLVSEGANKLQELI
jgi:putative GTP pyrophosphokinase